jgi:hypothetical protein
VNCASRSKGCLQTRLIATQPPFTANNRKKTMELIMKKKLTLPNYLSQDAKDLLTKVKTKKQKTK